MDKKSKNEENYGNSRNDVPRNRKDSIWGVILPDQRRNGRLVTNKQKTMWFKSVNFLEDIGCLNGGRVTQEDIDSDHEENGREARFSLRGRPQIQIGHRRASMLLV